ncbi:MAG TPA: ATP-binding cassette domain-containing protein [Gemmatimonadaceae bacterium]|jgi:osmoprotectant transport system ATP-binding protein|nr:ATP-binding cassette domain-containing protein [Gemmatimonadaceae bacterium]
MTPALSAVAVVKRFGSTTALDGLSLDIAEGECVALVGESGSGKTTLLRSFNALVRPDSGSVIVAGRDTATVDVIELRRSIGYVPQDGGLLPHWRVGRNVELVLRLTESRDDIAAQAGASLQMVGLDPAVFRTRWPRELSGGQRQRVAIARALAARPRVLLLDEPFGALDAISRADLQQSFAALRVTQTAPMTAVLVTHDLHEAFLLADRIAVLRRGRVEQVGAAEDLLARPATEYVRELLARARVTEADLAPLAVRNETR